MLLELMHSINNISTVNAILAINPLHQIAQRVPNCAIVANHDVLQSLNQSSLNIPSFGGFDSRIDKTFATSHRVEEKFLRGQPAEVRILDKPSRLRTKIIFCEMRECAMFVPKRKSSSLQLLLTNT